MCRFTAGFLWMCQGYYRHSEGYTPEWPDMAEYQGKIVHPQSWPEDLDYARKKVVVIGSGATAATLVPAIAGDCEHVTVHSASHTTSSRAAPKHWRIRYANSKSRNRITLVSRKTCTASGFHEAGVREPEAVKRELLRASRYWRGFDVETHFTRITTRASGSRSFLTATSSAEFVPARRRSSRMK